VYSKSETYTKTEVNDRFTSIIGGAPAVLDTLEGTQRYRGFGADANFSTTVATSLSAKAPINNPKFTGTVAGISKSMVGLA
jgi:hypothetical protein